MEAGVIAGLVLGIPIMFLPAAYVWYLNIGGIVGLVRERRKIAGKKLAEEQT